LVYAYSISDDKNYCDVTRVDLEPRVPVGTSLVQEGGSPYRYACAGEDLQPMVLVKPGLSEEDRFTLAFSHKMEKFANIVFGKVIATVGDLKDNPGVLGWPVVEVKKGCYFWLREIPMGAILAEEKDKRKEVTNMTKNSENLVFILHQTHDVLRNCEDKVFGEYELNAERYAVLTAIKYPDAPVKITDIARRLTRSVNSISMIIDRMVKAGLVKRVRDKKDRRVVFVSITSKGEALFNPATQAGQKFIQEILSPILDEDRQALVGLLETLRHKVSEYSDSMSQR